MRAIKPATESEEDKQNLSNSREAALTGNYLSDGYIFNTVDNKINPASFSNIDNMHAFVESSTANFKDKNQDKLNNLKGRINNLINELYDLILSSAYNTEKHRVPFYGIP